MDAAVAKPVVAVILLSLGFYVVYRFLRLGGARPTFKGHPSAMFLAPMGLVAGTLDAVGGGGWGPVGTTSLLSSGRLEPRKVVGSIDTSEFVVAVGGSLGFLIGLGAENINWGYAGALLAGGVIAAPVAAWLVKHLAARVLGTAAGGLIILTNSKTLLEAVGVPGVGVAVAAAVIFVLWIAGIVWAVKQERLSRAVGRRRARARVGHRLSRPQHHVVRRRPRCTAGWRRRTCTARTAARDGQASLTLADISDKLVLCASPPKPTMPSGP